MVAEYTRREDTPNLFTAAGVVLRELRVDYDRIKKITVEYEERDWVEFYRQQEERCKLAVKCLQAGYKIGEIENRSVGELEEMLKEKGFSA